MKIKLSDYIASFLVENGIKDIFTITGGGAMHLNDSFGHNPNLHCTYNHHEQACAIAAEGYARLSGKLPVVCVTSGPGGTNTLTGVLGSWLDSIPMFVISGQVKRSTTIWSTNMPMRQLGDQEFNIVDCVKSMSKYAVMVTDENQIAYHLEKALFLCKNGRPGPVWIDVPLDIQGATIETDNLVHFNPSDCSEANNPIVNDTDIEVIISKIKLAKRPVILAGSAIRHADAHKEFIEVIEKFNIPVVTAWNAHDNLWDSHPLYAGRPGTIGTRGGNFVVQNSDLLISLGCRLNVRQISYNWENFAKDAYKIMVDIDELELKKPTLSIDLPIHADVKDVLIKLSQAKYVSDNLEHKNWLKWCKDINLKYPAVLPKFYDSKNSINPYVFMDELFKHLKENEIVLTSNGSACVTSFQAAVIKKGQRLFTNSGCASMGYGLPAALGAAVSANGQKVICLEGDGSIQMNIQELQTIVHNKLNVKIFWLNNSGYHSIRQTQNNLFKPPMCGVNEDNGVSFPQAERIAIAYGLPFVKISSLDKIDEKLNEVLSTNQAVICEVIIDHIQYFEPKLSAKVLEDGKIVSPPLDDMFPFIDEKEYQAIKAVSQ